ncbi:putative tyrosine-protein kinase Wsck [Stylophora pistillata]|nr:putative tyrosine-protein kinase Wsck [Stylophora pistillata]
MTKVEVSDITAEIDLWPAEQRNGPISAYQIIILKVTDCVQELPRDFDVKLKDSNDKELNFYPFYIAAEIENGSVHDKSRKFTVGDGKSYGTFTNKELRRGENYIAYQRAITRHNGQILEGSASKVALISAVTPESLKNTKETMKGNPSEFQVLRVSVIALSCVVFVLFIVIGALIWRLRRTEPQKPTTTVYSEIPVRSGGHQVSEPVVYMELQRRPSEGKSREPLEYQSMQDTNVTPDYCNMGFGRGKSGKEGHGIYENFHN